MNKKRFFPKVRALKPQSRGLLPIKVVVGTRTCPYSSKEVEKYYFIVSVFQMHEK